MVETQSVLGLRHDNATHLVVVERFANLNLLRIHLITLRHHHRISACRSLLLNAAKHRGEIIVGQVWNNHADSLQWFSFAVSQTLGNEVRRIIMFTRVFLYFVSLRYANSWTIFQCTRHRCHRHIERLGNVLHCYGS